MSKWIRNRKRTDGCPKELIGKKADIRHRDGSITESYEAELFNESWNTSDNSDSDIMAYRIIEEEPAVDEKDPSKIAPKLWAAYKDVLNDEALAALRDVICEQLDKIAGHDDNDISSAFSWADTTQGNDFWADVDVGKYNKPTTALELQDAEIGIPEPVDEVMFEQNDSADMVNHPPHYTQGGIECIDAIKAALTEEEYRGYCKGNALKYIWREKHKGGNESLQKANWYLDRIAK